MKKISLLFILLLLPACTNVESTSTDTVIKGSNLTKVCLDGVNYYLAGYRMAPVFNRNGSVEVC